MAADARVRLHRSAPHGRGHHAVPPGDLRGREHLRGRRPHVPQGRAGGAAQARRRGHARHPALPAPGPPRPAAPHPRRPRGQSPTTVRRARPAEEREHRGGGRPADVPGHRHRDRHGQARPARADRGRRRGGPLARHLRRLHPAQPALLADGPADHVGREEHRLQPAGADRAVRDRRRRLQVPLHGQGRRLGQQVLPLPGDEGGPERGLHDEVPGGEDPLARHGRLPAVPPGDRRRRHQRRVRAEDREVRLRALPRRAARRGLPDRPRLPRQGAGGEGLRADAEDRHRRAVRRQVLLPRRARRPAAAARRVLPGRHRRLLLRRPPGRREDHRRGRLPGAAGDRPGALPAGDDGRAAHRGRGPDLDAVAIDLNRPMDESSPS